MAVKFIDEWSPNGPFGIVDAKNIKGGVNGPYNYSSNVTTLDAAAKANVPVERRVDGMRVILYNTFLTAIEEVTWFPDTGTFVPSPGSYLYNGHPEMVTTEGRIPRFAEETPTLTGGALTDESAIFMKKVSPTLEQILTKSPVGLRLTGGSGGVNVSEINLAAGVDIGTSSGQVSIFAGGTNNVVIQSEDNDIVMLSANNILNTFGATAADRFNVTNSTSTKVMLGISSTGVGFLRSVVWGSGAVPTATEFAQGPQPSAAVTFAARDSFNNSAITSFDVDGEIASVVNESGVNGAHSSIGVRVGHSGNVGEGSATILYARKISATASEGGLVAAKNGVVGGDVLRCLQGTGQNELYLGEDGVFEFAQFRLAMEGGDILASQGGSGLMSVSALATHGNSYAMAVEETVRSVSNVGQALLLKIAGANQVSAGSAGFIDFDVAASAGNLNAGAGGLIVTNQSVDEHNNGLPPTLATFVTNNYDSVRVEVEGNKRWIRCYNSPSA